jgi:hypothetical protein
MRSLRTLMSSAAAVLLAGCNTTTQCDCIAPSVVIFGNVTGAEWPVRIEARLGPSPCQSDAVATGSVNIADTQHDGSYRVGVPLPAAGPACVIVTATKFADRPVTITRRIEAAITQMPLSGSQEIRADIAFVP